MRPEIEELASWYRQDTGAKVASVLAAAIAPLIRRSATARLLALGYCTPFLDGFDPASVERLVLACPAEQGGSCWPSPECNPAAEVDELMLPLAAALFDQALVVPPLAHAAPAERFLPELCGGLPPD